MMRNNGSILVVKNREPSDWTESLINQDLN